MKTQHTIILALAGLLGGSRSAFSQSAAPEVNLAASVAAAQQQYTQAFTSHPQLYNGPEYLDYSKRYHARKGHQFFGSPEKQLGRVYYNDHDFRNVALAYDLVLDQVVLPLPNSPLTLRLVNENVRDFAIADQRFVRVVTDSATGTVIRPGFYELLFDGRAVQVLAKHIKRLQEHVVQPNIDVEFIAKDRLYLKKGNRYFPINKKGAAMRLFADRGKEMQEYLRDQKLSFKSAELAATLVKLASHYDSLPPR